MIEKTRKYRGCRKVRFSETSPSERLILNRKVIKRKLKVDVQLATRWLKLCVQGSKEVINRSWLGI